MDTEILTIRIGDVIISNFALVVLDGFDRASHLVLVMRAVRMAPTWTIVLVRSL